ARRNGRGPFPRAPSPAIAVKPRAAPPSYGRHRAAGSRRPGSTVTGAFDAIEQLGHVVQGDSGLEVSQIARFHLERRSPRGETTSREATAQQVVDDLL